MKHVFYFAMLLISYGLLTSISSVLAQDAVKMVRPFENKPSNFPENYAQPAGDIKAVTPAFPFPLPAAQVKAMVLAGVDPTLRPTVEAVFKFQYNIAVWKVLYTSRDLAGNLVDVSGLIIVPLGLSEPAPVGSYAHGTIFADREAPSRINIANINDQAAIGLAFATDGYVMFLSDYQAHGDSKGEFSLYVAQLEANDILNGLRATQSFCISKGLPLNGNVSLYGYSQGAHAVLAAQRELEKYPIAGVNLLVNIAGAGPYDLSGVQRQSLLDNPQYPNPAIIAGITEGYQNVYGNVYHNPTSTYAYAEIPLYYNRQLSRNEINQRIAALGITAWPDMYRPAFYNTLQYNPVAPLLLDLRLNDVYDWRPEKDVKLCYCSEDELVSPLSTQRALLSFNQKGALNARAVPLGPFDHYTCAPFATLYAKTIFDTYNGKLISPLASARSEMDPRQILATQVNIKEYDWPALKNFLEQDITFAGKSLEEQYPVNMNARIAVYPNPVNSLAHLQLPFSEDGINLQLYDPSGKLVKSVIAYESDFTLDVSDVPDGIYLIKIKGDQQVSARMIVHK